jgi:DNA-binding response OmpR family regulator
MQPKYTFGEVEILLVDNDLGSRNGVRTILSNNGFSNVILGTELSKIRDVLSSGMPDLIISGVDFPDGKITDLLPDIRNSKLGHNPFVPIIVILGETTPEVITKLMNAGPDDVVMKPISTKGLLQRMHKQIHNRLKATGRDTQRHGPRPATSKVVKAPLSGHSGGLCRRH